MLLLGIIIGFICGLLLSIFLALIWVGIALANGLTMDNAVKLPFQKHFVSKPRGAIYEAPLDIDLAREEIIERNRSEGRETKIDELI